MTDARLRVGDVALDQAQGEVVQVVARTPHDVRSYPGRDLSDVYGNQRCGVTATDSVVNVVYADDLTSEPAGPYAMPVSRLARIETEAADGGRPVADRVRQALLADLFAEAHRLGNGDLTQCLEAMAGAVAGESLVGDAKADARGRRDGAQDGAASQAQDADE